MLTSRGESPASARARGPDSAAAETRKSRRPPEVWAMASALPSSRTGGFLRSRARSGCTTTRAPPPSVITQQSSRCSGRSEERRVGKECRSRWLPDNENNKGQRQGSDQWRRERTTEDERG